MNQNASVWRERSFCPIQRMLSVDEEEEMEGEEVWFYSWVSREGERAGEGL